MVDRVARPIQTNMGGECVESEYVEMEIREVKFAVKPALLLRDRFRSLPLILLNAFAVGSFATIL